MRVTSKISTCKAFWHCATLAAIEALSGSVLAGATFAQQPTETSLLTTEAIVEQSSPATVIISVSTPQGGRLGSGFLVDDLGTIVTNHHVIENATAGKISLPSGESYAGFEILGTDELRDFAIIRVPGFGLPHLTLGNSDSIRVGQEVTAIGAPYGLESTVSTGIISAVREVGGFRLLQLTAPISQGSSGGPIISRGGQVIAVAVAQISEGQNLNFAVPINYVRGMLSILDNGESVSVAPLEETLEPATVPPVNTFMQINTEGFRQYTARAEVSGGEDSDIRVRLFDPEGPAPPRLEISEEGEEYYYRLVVDPSTFEPLTFQSRASFERDDRRYVSYADLSFSEGSVQGTAKNWEGPERHIDRDLPDGVILGGWTDTNNWTVFFFLDGEVMGGQTHVFSAYDPWDNVIREMQFDVVHEEEIKVDGKEYNALVVDITADGDRTRAYFRAERPRILLKLEGMTNDWEASFGDVTLD